MEWYKISQWYKISGLTDLPTIIHKIFETNSSFHAI